MSKIKVLIVEDELLMAEEMAGLLRSKGFDVLGIVDTVVEAKRALQVYQLDIVLVDIKLKGTETGIDLARYIQENNLLPFIFITSHTDQELIASALATKPSAFLVKPYNKLELQVSIELAFYNYQEKKTAFPKQSFEISDQSSYSVNDHIFIKDNHVFEKLSFADILWLKAESSYVSIFTKIKHYLLTSDTLGSILEKIQSGSMLRVHRSYAVNIQHVDAIEGNQLRVMEELIPVGKSYRNSIKEHFRML